MTRTDQERRDRLAEAWDRGHPPRDIERERAEIALRLASPKRPGHVDAADPNHLPLFVAANEPRFL